MNLIELYNIIIKQNGFIYLILISIQRLLGVKFHDKNCRNC